jgi:hypothetical protein
MNTKIKKQRLKSIFRRNNKKEDKKKIQISLVSLRNMVKTKEQEDILKLIEHETIPSVRQAWIDYFLEKTKPAKIKADQ